MTETFDSSIEESEVIDEMGDYVYVTLWLKLDNQYQ